MRFLVRIRVRVWAGSSLSLVFLLIISLQVCNYIPRVIIIMRAKLVSLDWTGLEELALARGIGVGGVYLENRST